MFFKFLILSIFVILHINGEKLDYFGIIKTVYSVHTEIASEIGTSLYDMYKNMVKVDEKEYNPFYEERIAMEEELDKKQKDQRFEVKSYDDYVRMVRSKREENGNDAECYNAPVDFDVQDGKVPWSRFVRYNQTDYFCNDEQVLKMQYDELVTDPDNQCNSTTYETEKCFCSEDRWGFQCEEVRPFTCTFNRTFPIDDCIFPKGTELRGGIPLNGDFSCIRHSLDMTDVQFQFTMKCFFTAPPNYGLYNLFVSRDSEYTDIHTGEKYDWDEIRESFAYSVSTPEFNRTKFFDEPFVARPYNFIHFKDSYDTGVSLRNSDFYWGQEILSISLNYTNLKEDFLVANRLYVEAGVRSVDGHRMKHFARFFVDFPELSEPGYTDIQTIILASTLPPTLTLAAIIIVIIIIIYMIRKYKKKV